MPNCLVTDLGIAGMMRIRGFSQKTIDAYTYHADKFEAVLERGAVHQLSLFREGVNPVNFIQRPGWYCILSPGHTRSS